MDRFMMRLSIGYPEREQEIRMAAAALRGETPDTAEVVCSPEEVLSMKEEAAAVSVSEALLGYMEEIVELTRQEERFVLGASPRALLALMRASQGKAMLQGLVLSADARLRKEDADSILKSLILRAKIPV